MDRLSVEISKIAIDAMARKDKEIAKLKQERAEFAAQFEEAHAFIRMLANSSPADDMDSTPFDAQEFLDTARSGPDALREIQARTLEEAAKEFGDEADSWFVVDRLRDIAAAKRKGE